MQQGRETSARVERVVLVVVWVVGCCLGETEEVGRVDALAESHYSTVDRERLAGQWASAGDHCFPPWKASEPANSARNKTRR